MSAEDTQTQRAAEHLAILRTGRTIEPHPLHDALADDLDYLLTALAQAEAERDTARQELARIHKEAKCLRLEEVLRSAYDSETLRKLRAFELLATARIELAAARRGGAAQDE